MKKTTPTNRTRVQAVRDRLMPPTEASLRARARRRGFRMEKSRQPWSIDNHGHFMVFNSHGYCTLGERFSATLAEIAAFLRDEDDDDDDE
jgi:hypothetical protein